MDFLADESVDFAVVRALREAGYDVVAVAEVARGFPDIDIVRLSVESSRVLLTEDRDFGRLVFAHSQGSNGIVYIRYPATARDVLATAVLDLVAQHGERLTGSFVVMQPGRARIRRQSVG